MEKEQLGVWLGAGVIFLVGCGLVAANVAHSQLLKNPNPSGIDITGDEQLAIKTAIDDGVSSDPNKLVKEQIKSATTTQQKIMLEILQKQQMSVAQEDKLTKLQIGVMALALKFAKGYQNGNFSQIQKQIGAVNSQYSSSISASSSAEENS